MNYINVLIKNFPLYQNKNHLDWNQEYYQQKFFEHFIKIANKSKLSWLDKHQLGLKSYLIHYRNQNYHHLLDTRFKYLLKVFFSLKHTKYIFKSFLLNQNYNERWISYIFKTIKIINENMVFQKFLFNFDQYIPRLSHYQIVVNGINSEAYDLMIKLIELKEKYDVLGLDIEVFEKDHQDKIQDAVNSLNIYSDYISVKLFNLYYLIPNSEEELLKEAKKVEKIILSNPKVEYPIFDKELNIENIIEYKEKLVALTKEQLA